MSQPTADRDAADGIHADAHIIVNKPPAEVFQFWRALENFPRFMSHVKEVRRLSDKRYLWRVTGPVGTELSWEASVTEVDANRRIGWAAEPGSSLPNRGEVRFRPEGSGTHIQVDLHYQPPAGKLGHAVATLLGQNPGQQMQEDLGRLKDLLETGVTQTAGQAVTAQQVRHDEAARRSVH